MSLTEFLMKIAESPLGRAVLRLLSLSDRKGPRP